MSYVDWLINAALYVTIGIGSASAIAAVAWGFTKSEYDERAWPWFVATGVIIAAVVFAAVTVAFRVTIGLA